VTDLELEPIRCTCECVRPATHMEPAEWVQDPNCPEHYLFRTCRWCGKPTLHDGRLVREGWVPDAIQGQGTVVGRLCPEHSADAGELLADAREAELERDL
jgi:hypothetical protein